MKEPLARFAGPVAAKTTTGGDQMATNLVSQIMDFVTPDIISKIAGYFGLDRYSTQKAIGASVPAMLAGLVGLASKPDGAKQLSSVLSQQPSGTLDNLRSLTTGNEQRMVAENGAGLLSSLFGGNMFSALTGAVGKYAGIGEGTSKSLLGMLAPLVLGTVAQQQRQSGLDANGLSSLLSSQKDNIVAAMPSGFGNLLGGTGVLDSLGDAWRGATAAASAGASRFATSANEATADARRAAQYTARDTRASSSGWLPWALGLLVLAGLAWWLTSQPSNRVAQQPTTVTAQNLTVGGVNISSQVTAAINSMKSAIQGISDPSTAQAALPRLQQAAAQLDNVSGLAVQLPSTGRNALASRVASEIPALDRDFNTVLSRPEIAAVVGPEINGLRTKLNALARG
jgi:hypothetical protein